MMRYRSAVYAGPIETDKKCIPTRSVLLGGNKPLGTFSRLLHIKIMHCFMLAYHLKPQ